MEIEVVLDAGAIIGETPTWSPYEQALYWLDIKKPALFRYDVTTKSQQSWPMPSDIGGFALIQGSLGAVVALRHGLFLLDFASGDLRELAAAPFDPRLFRFNETACDAAGRLWIGVMFDPLEKGVAPQQSQLHSFTFTEGLRAESDTAELHNGMAWSPDGRSFYLSHSKTRVIYRYDFEAGSQRLGTRTVFAEVPEGSGIPDGAAVDTEGGYWCALHGAGKLRRYDSDGRPDRDIALPVSQPTMCAFGGSDLQDLYVTSASEKLTPAQLKEEPLAGALLKLRSGKQGVPRPSVARWNIR